MKRQIWAAALLGLFPAVMAGCNADGTVRTSEREPSISVTASNRDMMVGDTTTFTVASRNTVGRDAEVRWTSTGGDLDIQENGRIARASFPQPGTYTVNAILLIDGREADRDSINVNVKPLK